MKPDYTQPDALPVPGQDCALFLDFDGTLVEFAAAPDGIEVDRSVAPLLRCLEHGLSGALAIVSGRRIWEIDQYLALKLNHVSGMHGFEYRIAGQAAADIMHSDVDTAHLQRCRVKLQEFSSRWPGTLLEDKEQSLALHYRQCPEVADEGQALTEQLVAAAEGALVLLRGNMVFEIKRSGIDKGQAVNRFMAAAPFLGRRPVFVGDDITDEYGFRAAKDAGGYGIIVGGREPTAAAARLADVTAMIAWLNRGCLQLDMAP